MIRSSEFVCMEVKMNGINQLNTRAIALFCVLGLAPLSGCGGSNDAKTRADSNSSGEEITLAETPSREEVQAELRTHAAHIANCGMGGGEVVPVMITFEGVSGSVNRIEYPENEDLARSVRICIESNLVNAAVTPFLREHFTITYPFKLREELKRMRPGSADGEDAEAMGEDEAGAGAASEADAASSAKPGAR